VELHRAADAQQQRRGGLDHLEGGQGSGVLQGSQGGVGQVEQRNAQQCRDLGATCRLLRRFGARMVEARADEQHCREVDAQRRRPTQRRQPVSV
jgi:hypothetical protein